MDEITITWHIDDLLELDDNLSIKQRREILQYAKKNHDCNQGINWDFLKDCIEIFKSTDTLN